MSRPNLSRRPVVLVFARSYLPGYRAGGPVRSLSNLVAALSAEYDFRIVCLDRDHRSDISYPDINVGQWQRRGGATIFYAAPSDLGFRFCQRVVSDVNPDMIYLNSLFDRSFSMVPLVALGRGRSTPILLTPRGEFSSGALGLKAIRKRCFVLAARGVGLYKYVFWHACSEPEAEQIRSILSPEAGRLFLATNLPEAESGCVTPHAEKQPGRLRLVLASRVVPMKNILAAIRIASQLSGSVQLDLWGLIEDQAYWDVCQQQIALCPDHVSVRHRGEIAHEELRERLHEYDVMLLPTLGENFGHAILEGLAAGLPVVISDRTPWRHLKHAGVGADLPLEDEQAFVRELSRYQVMTESDMAKIREACTHYVATWRASHVNLDAYRSMFDTVLASNS